ncbi:lytic murein transglycosylase [Pararhodobacter aggregans]|uniref:Peptidoglycan-binding protein n=1 Tax=Pararhodobacter aggregans TaxID=404875 RepID=A0A2T7UWG6_9RHOB|nr:lytic murein transglycosylase [Pararhodobacter aggregans]PTX04794.1 lytic murein transglycosylase [Pararhodobacter aggregans]PVE49125.1 peptidoglycan-binding protein [Pararhodobacter aggregans]
MPINRRLFGAGLLGLGLAACSRSLPSRASSASPDELPPDLLPASNREYDAWVEAFRSRAEAAGITRQTLNTAFRGAGFLPGVVTRDQNQTEFRRSLEDYLSIAASDERIEKGRAAFARHRRTLEAIEADTGVDAKIVTAIWGLESYYGERQGLIPVISATSTLAFEGRRGRYFERELIAALRIVQNGDIPASRMTGSWAGAMGHTQCMPTVFQEYAVDFTGDGRRDIWSEDPSDALATTATYLRRHGWTRGLPWGRELLSGSASGTVLQPQAGGPRFDVTSNFRVIKRYNPSDAYALGVGHLADRIGGAGPLRSPFPPDENGLSRADRIALQQRLTARGFDTQGSDGVIGRNTESAIRAYQQSRGMAVTGTPSRELLQSLG